MLAIDELSLLLRPAAGGVYVVSTGRQQQLDIQQKIYQVRTELEIQERFIKNLHRIKHARAVMLGIPSDVGAGYVRGANLGPQAVRTALLQLEPNWPEQAREMGVVDIGDVIVVPQLLHDSMLSTTQREATAQALFPNVSEALRTQLPVSPLSIAERAWDLVFSLNPDVRPITLGGDHSTAWPVVSALSRIRHDRWSIVQIDAHTDLLKERLGIQYCFATWSYHANELLQRDGRLVQVGTRASRFDRDHWQSTLNVRQFWAVECREDPVGAIDKICAYLKSLHVKSVYFSNDIDGTDSHYANATGTPEPDGLDPDFVLELMDRLGQEFELCGGDIMEVAPLLQHTSSDTKHTLEVAASYLHKTIRAIWRDL